ncbi:hypothetical protein PN419_00535 [Halorubrum ezzemoulense]|uniref:hypothetical protein n=1 Tax=Halorubrum ezzemoulense TaxID=337243 RepID=UPI00232F33F2|nr:hypothetical protein [Halorubrum ezzemoulense]MDB9247494.1 hypothetical protein [Halorubrum ezzemoulense]MDB9258597.1 hypothetical protein [Halorubrum ezzemoulense]MDB9264544.1 hypothetical protein [Halorubrum ezzemoulense]MDB9268958.1 hypothetical protein [Halorubrum ezzemoulense]MDB9271512.1 hypothetical protein [Halorubrum ezzemoulense]
MNDQLLLKQLDKRRRAHGITERAFSNALNYANPQGWTKAVEHGGVMPERLIRADAVLDHYDQHDELPPVEYPTYTLDAVEQHRRDAGVQRRSLSIVAGYEVASGWDMVHRQDARPSDERLERAGWALDYRDEHGYLPLPHETLVAVLP